jgi:hypothetical protein
MSAVDRVRAFFGGTKTVQEYEPLGNDDDDNVRPPASGRPDPTVERPFSLLEYLAFFLLGIAMLWAW